jgi:ABC-type arginine transport system ATPase subunit
LSFAVERALERTGAVELAERMLTTLPGGELQRVQIAVGLAQEAPVLIADEPTPALAIFSATQPCSATRWPFILAPASESTKRIASAMSPASVNVLNAFSGSASRI